MIYINYRNDESGKLNNWCYDFKVLDLSEAQISKFPLRNNDPIIITNESSYVVFIKYNRIFYVNLKSLEIVFKADLSNLNGIIDLNEYAEVKSIENTDDMVGIDKKNKKLFYFCLKQSSNENSEQSEFKLIIFTSKIKKFEFSEIKLKKNFLIAFKRTKLEIMIFDLNKVRNDCCFSKDSIIFRTKISDRWLIYDLSSDLKYFITFQKPRSLYLYRVADSNLIATIPVMVNIKELVCSGKLIFALLSNYDVISFIIADLSNDSHFDLINKLKYK